MIIALSDEGLHLGLEESNSMDSSQKTDSSQKKDEIINKDEINNNEINKNKNINKGIPSPLNEIKLFKCNSKTIACASKTALYILENTKLSNTHNICDIKEISINKNDKIAILTFTKN
ncbi:hypothetical protein DMUE_6046, partial [Dictyocoela muelleri]